MKNTKAMTLLIILVLIAGITACKDRDKDKDSVQPVITGDEVSQITKYPVGDSWIVEGQWEMKVTSVEKAAISTVEIEDKEDAKAIKEAYIVTYEYKNLGYINPNSKAENKGLNINLEDVIIIDSNDNSDKLVTSASGLVDSIAIDKDASFTAKTLIAVSSKDGIVELLFDKLDGNGDKQYAVFTLTGETAVAK